MLHKNKACTKAYLFTNREASSYNEFLQRGRSYTFTVEGGDRPSDPELYHPFVITNDDLGGYWRMPKDGSRRLETKIYAGVKYTFRGIPQVSAVIERKNSISQSQLF